MATPTSSEATRKATFQQNKKQDKENQQSSTKPDSRRKDSQSSQLQKSSKNDSAVKPSKEKKKALGVSFENNEIDSLTLIFWTLLLLIAIIVDVLDFIPVISDVYDWILDIVYWPVAMLFVALFQGVKKGIMARGAIFQTLGTLGNAFPVVDAIPFAVAATLLILLDMKYNIFAIKERLTKPTNTKTITKKST